MSIRVRIWSASAKESPRRPWRGSGASADCSFGLLESAVRSPNGVGSQIWGLVPRLSGGFGGFLYHPPSGGMTCRFFCWFRWDSAVSFGVSEMGGGRRVWTVILMVIGVSVCSRVCSGFVGFSFFGFGVVSGVSHAFQACSGAWVDGIPIPKGERCVRLSGVSRHKGSKMRRRLGVSPNKRALLTRNSHIMFDPTTPGLTLSHVAPKTCRI